MLLTLTIGLALFFGVGPRASRPILGVGYGFSDRERAALPHMNATMVKGILERRLFLTMTDLNAFWRNPSRKNN
jgi:hypothetical protein